MSEQKSDPSSAAAVGQRSNEAASSSSGAFVTHAAGASSATDAASSSQRQLLVRVEDIGLDESTAPPELKQTAVALAAIDWSPLDWRLDSRTLFH